jgi:hypothetical protein
MYYSETIFKRRAIEALRSGVPNRDVVRYLPPKQIEIHDKFVNLLDSAKSSWNFNEQVKGLLISGDFGSGKSHWLEYFRHLALERKFVCSRIVLNKETPLHDIVKVYRACVSSARIAGKIGPALEEISFDHNRNKAPYYRELSSWVEKNKDIDQRLPAILYLFDKNLDNELLEKIIMEWSGFRMKVKELKDALKEIGELNNYQITGAKSFKEQVFYYFEFLSRFFYTAGFSGWVILIDETEMISKYSIRQRGRSYANLARLLQETEGINIPGIATVFTITRDYVGNVIYGQKDDKNIIKLKLSDTTDEKYIKDAELGMKIMEKGQVELEVPSREKVEEVYNEVKSVYHEANNWSPNDIYSPEAYGSATRMRQYIRSWINKWDFARIYEKDVDTIQETNVGPKYEEE